MMNPVYVKTSKHLKDYLSQSEALKPFYAQPLYPDWQKLAGEVSEGFKQSAVVEELIRQNSDSDDAQVRQQCKLLLQKNTVMIVTGQQLGLLLSPLYIIYKTLSTIKLARQLSKDYKDFNFVPVFWLEGEDHDYDEVKSLKVFSSANNLQTISMADHAELAGFSMNKRSLGNEISSVIRTLKEVLQPTDFSLDVFKKLENIYTPGANWLEAFRAHMAELFIGNGLLFFNAGSPEVKTLSKDFFKSIVSDNAKVLEAFTNSSLQMQETGYKNQVNIQQDRAYLFYSPNGGPRLPLLRNGEEFNLKDGTVFKKEELLQEIEKNPHYFSSTVLTRPLWQSWLLPTVSYVAGAAEIAYWGQLRKAFKVTNLVMPHLLPRHSITLVEPKTSRFIAKYAIDINTIDPDKNAFIKEYFLNTYLGEVTDTLAVFEKQTQESRKKITELTQAVDPTLSGPVDKSYASIISTIEKLQNRFSERVKEKEEITRNHLNAIHEALLPQGNLQERMLSSVYFENKYGPGWLKLIIENVGENFSDHLIVSL